MIGRRGEEKVGVSAWDLNEGVVHEGECVCVDQSTITKARVLAPPFTCVCVWVWVCVVDVVTFYVC